MNMEKQDEMPAIDLTISEKLDSYEELLESMKKQAFADDYLEKKSDPNEELLASMKKQALENFYQFFQEKEKELLSIRKKQRPTKKQDEILAVDPTITDTEAETFPAATSSDAVGIVEEEAAETIPQVLEKKSDLYEELMSFMKKQQLTNVIFEKLDEILAVDPTITDTEAETFPAATSSDAVGIVEEEAAETIPQVLEKKSDLYEELLASMMKHKKLLASMKKRKELLASMKKHKKPLPFWGKQRPTNVLFELLIWCLIGGPRNPKKNREPNLLPLSTKDLANTSIEQKVLTWKAFLCFVVGGMLDISPQQYGILLMICIGFLSYYSKNSTTPFDLQFGTTTPVQSLISFSEAIYAFFPEITHITKFMLCYVLSWMLVLPKRPVMPIFLVLLLISAPIFYFPELVHKASASGVHVACGSFKLPLIGFAILGAVGLSLICGFVTLLMVYLMWRFIYKGGKPTDRVIEVSLDGLSEILLG